VLDLMVWVGAPILGIGVLMTLLKSGISRIAYCVIGGLITFQAQGNTVRLIYLCGSIVCFAIALGRLLTSVTDYRWKRYLIWMALGDASVSMVLLVNLLESGQNGVGVSRWVTEATPYILLVVLPIVGIEAGRSSAQGLLTLLMVSVSVLAPIAFMVDWLNRRGVSALPFGRILFASIPLSCIALSFGIAKLAHSRKLIPWALIAALTPCCVLLTGTRTGFVLLFGALGAMGRKRPGRLSASTMFFLLLGIGLLISLFIPILGNLVASRPDFYARRFGDIQAILSGENDLLSSDASFRGRSFQTELSMDIFAEHPLLGEGLGVVHYGAQVLDTPVAPLSQFGIIGCTAIGAMIAVWFLLGRNLYLQGESVVGSTTLRVFGVCMMVYAPFSSPLSDKGLSLAVCLMGAVMTCESGGARTEHTHDLRVSHSGIPGSPVS
jgi:hypothetical protein